jgi:hypothetical protein
VAAPALAARAVVAMLVDDLETWGVRIGLLVLVVIALPTPLAAVGFGALLALLRTVTHPFSPLTAPQGAEVSAVVAPDHVNLGASARGGGRVSALLENEVA